MHQVNPVRLQKLGAEPQLDGEMRRTSQLQKWQKSESNTYVQLLTKALHKQTPRTPSLPHKCQKNSRRGSCQPLTSTFLLWKYANKTPWFPTSLPEDQSFFCPSFWKRKAEGGEKFMFREARFLDPNKYIHYQAKKCSHKQLCAADLVTKLRLSLLHFPLRVNFQSQNYSVRFSYYISPSAKLKTILTYLTPPMRLHAGTSQLGTAREWRKNRHTYTH